tara:strand:- start:903 stop:1142 length:240 start_codon:yes stop_codon:yes gene_type:complete
MIDTDKYEGHDNWEGTKVNMANEANKLLIADAPLLLEEVKRLQKEHDTVRGWFLDIDNYMMEHHYDMWQEIRKEIGLDD